MSEDETNCSKLESRKSHLFSSYQSVTLVNKKIAVIGMGYVGIPAAVLLAIAGYKVVGIQRRSKRSGWKIEWLNKGDCPIGGKEPELPELLKEAIKGNRFSVTDDFSTVQDVDFILIDVQTPIDDRHIPQYKSLINVCHKIGKYLTPGKVVIIESTVAPGTTNHLVKPILEKESGLKAILPDGFGLCFSYERVMVGRLIHNIREYPKIVGGGDAESIRITMDMYRSIVRGGVYGTDTLTAEVSKTVENAYRDVQIAFANEVALLCESFGINVYDVREFVNGLPNDNSSPGSNPIRNMLYPGAGVGGHCLPKDTWLLLHGYNQHTIHSSSFPCSILTDARYLNDWMPIHMVELLESGLLEAKCNIKDAIVCVLGYAFLENSDDSRNTPTILFLKELEKRGAKYKIHDPYVKHTEEGYQIEPDLDVALQGCHALVLMTKHDSYITITPEKLQNLLFAKVIIDGRNLFDSAKFTNAGFIYKGVGYGRNSSNLLK